MAIVARKKSFRRSSLPHYIVRSHIPGPLALADDGTQVRGRWGARTSGHGIGGRSLRSHPLGRQETSAIEDAIRDIDKACARSARHSVPTPGRITDDILTRLAADRDEAEDRDTIDNRLTRNAADNRFGRQSEIANQPRLLQDSFQNLVEIPALGASSDEIVESSA